MSTVALLSSLLVTAGPVTLTVDTSLDRRTISPFIYGSNQPDWAGRGRNVTLGRLGGNRWTAYNWETNASNAGEDWHNQNDDYLGGGDEPLGAVKPYAKAAIEAGAAVVITVPIAGYVAADKNGGGDVNQTPNYLNVRFHRSLPRMGGNLTVAPNKTDRVVYQNQFVMWCHRQLTPSIVGAPPVAGAPNLTKWNGGNAKESPYPTPLWFSLDNEPDLWNSTHPRIWPTKVTYAELARRTTEFGRSVKAVWPKSPIFGSVNYGWHGYMTLQDAPDAGGRVFLEWFLAEMRRQSILNGRRLLDVLDLHYYSEARGGGRRVVEDTNDLAVVRARLQSTRSLWDPTYTEDSWITQWSTQGPIRLIPRVQDMIRRNYTGTRLAFTEYSFGGGNHISGGLAQADALGIFGRQGVFAANRWHLLGNEDFAYGAIDLYRNFDGNGGRFGNVSVRASTSDVANVTVYGAIDTPDAGRVTVVAINKSETATPVTLRLVSPAALKTVSAYRLAGTSSSVAPVAGVTLGANKTITTTLPALSATVFAVRP